MMLLLLPVPTAAKRQVIDSSPLRVNEHYCADLLQLQLVGQQGVISGEHHNSA